MEKSSSMNTKYFINSAIAVALMVCFRFIPPFGAMTPLGMELLGIFLGLLYAWITVDMIWPSIVGLVLIGFSGYVETGGVAAVLTSVVSNPVLQMLIWLFAFSAIIEITGLGAQLAKRLIGSKLCKGRPWLLSVFIFVAAALVAALGNGIAAILLCWSFVYSISKQAGYTKADKWPRMMVVAVLIAVVAGVASMPFQAGVIGPFAYLYAASGDAINSFNSFQYMVFGILYLVLLTAVFFLLLRVVFRPDMSRLATVDNQMDVEPFTTEQKVALAAFVGLILVVVLPSVLPAGNPLKAVLDQIGLAGLTLLLIAVVTFLRNKEGKALVTFKQLADAGIPWPAIFMIGTAIYTGTALASAGTGFTDTLLGLFSPVLAGTGATMFCVIIVLVTLILTNIIANAPVTAIMIPVMYPFVAAMGVNPILATVLVIVVSNAGVLLPSASPNAAILYGNSEWVSAKDVWTFGGVGVASIGLVALLLIPIGGLIFV